MEHRSLIIQRQGKTYVSLVLNYAKICQINYGLKKKQTYSP